MIGAFRKFSTLVRDAVASRTDRVRWGVEIVLALALIVQLGRLSWILLGPATPAATPAAASARFQPADPSIFQRFDAFFRTGGRSSLAEASAAGSGQMRLYGLRSDGAGGGSAIIGLADGRQVSVGAGEEVEPGLVLQAVGPDYVTLARGASLSQLIFSDIPMGTAPPPSPPSGPQTVTPPSSRLPEPAARDASAARPPPGRRIVSPRSGSRPEPATTGASVDPARLMAQAGLRPRMRGARLVGFTVSGSGDAAVLRAAGLQPGDVILAVNGQPLNSLERLAAVRGELATSASAELRYERDGRVQISTIRTGR